MNRIRDSKGFTLIELMIVVAILGILAAIVIPEFEKYREKSKDAKIAEMIMGKVKLTPEEKERYKERFDSIAVIIKEKSGKVVKLTQDAAKDIKGVLQDKSVTKEKDNSNLNSASLDEPEKHSPVAKTSPDEDNPHNYKPKTVKKTLPEKRKGVIKKQNIVREVYVPRYYDLVRPEWRGDELYLYICPEPEYYGDCEFVNVGTFAKNEQPIIKEQ